MNVYTRTPTHPIWRTFSSVAAWNELVKDSEGVLVGPEDTDSK